MTIRDAQQPDTVFLDAMLTQLIRHEKRWDNNIDKNTVISDNYKNLIGQDECKLLVAEDNGEIIGYLCGFIIKQPMYCEPIAILDALYVCEHHRRKGCATALIDRFKEIAIMAGAACVELKVFSDNPAKDLYSSIGFEETKKYMRLPL